jgi:hypothetical protein
MNLDKKIKLSLLTILLFTLSVLAIYTSSAPRNLTKGILVFLGVSISAALICSLFLSIWFKGRFIEKYKKSFKIALPLNFACFLLGYSYVLIKTLMLS